MSVDTSLPISQLLLSALGTRSYTFYPDRIPRDSALIVVSNHRSFMDAPLLMSALQRPIRFACHHYMGQVPILREVVTRLGCFPLGQPDQVQQSFFYQASRLLRSRQVVGVFPEGAQPMVTLTEPSDLQEFHRGFAHLALRVPVAGLAVLPVAIASHEEHVNSGIPLKLLNLVDPSEPLFDQSGCHPMVIYRRVNMLIGRPQWICPSHQKDYQGKQAKSLVVDLTQRCHDEINQLLREGYY